MLAHDNILASIESFHAVMPHLEHRIVSLLPLSHLLEQAVGLFYALSVGADVLYVRSRNPRVIFDALRDHKVTSMVVVPQVLDLFWSAVTREVEKRGRTATFDRLRGIARHLPMGIRRRIFGSVHGQLGGHLRLFVSAARSCRPRSSRAGRTSASSSCRATAPPRPAPAAARPSRTTAWARSGGRRPASRCASHPKARSSSRAGRCSRATGEPRGDRRRVHRGRLVQDRRHRPLRRRGPAHPVRPDEGHHRAAQRLQRVSRGHRERPAHRRHPRLRGPRDQARAHRSHRPRRHAARWHARSGRHPERASMPR